MANNQNTSNIIEAYLRKLLEEAREIEIKRAEIASLFDVVPSQINYVIKTRFTPSKGFDVESKRGGGGYIRIAKYQYSAKHEFLIDIYKKIPNLLTEKVAQDIIQLLFDEKILNEQAGSLVLLLLGNPELPPLLRSKMMKDTLQRLDRENEIY